MVQYAALLGPWPTHVPDNSMQPAGTLGSLRLLVPLQQQPRPPASPQHTPSTARLSHAGLNSTSLLAATDLSELYHGLLHPPGVRAAAALNASRTPTVAVIYSQPSQPTQPGSSSPQLDGADTPTGQLLLWYFLGLAAVQPLVLWLQAAALVVVLNVLRHLPEQQLQWLLGKCSGEPAGADASASGRGSSGQLAGCKGGQSSSSRWQRDREEYYDVFLPLSYDWRARWTWLDWLRFRLLKHSLDIVLVSWHPNTQGTPESQAVASARVSGSKPGSC